MRVLSAVVLAPVALGLTILGGPAFAGLVLVASLIVQEEWLRLIAGGPMRKVAIAGGLGLALATLAWVVGWGAASVAAVAAGGAAAALSTDAAHRKWVLAGVAYAAALLLPALALRWDAAYGLAGILFLFATVWTTDVAAYFVGRAVGGPKLAPRVSPKKTWSGGIGGAAAGTAAGCAVVALLGIPVTWQVTAVALAASVVSQGGDLFESWFKRRFGAKDSGSLIPGHGGLMDRLDGVIAAVLFLVLVGLIRGGAGTPAASILIW
ncbi:phosphatidate cytidylyltransferase [Blastochloris sulfoviridis]|uniref:Phosphatidate cytidylyltransferase n=1 Tax=Blastochloris sulfoviridis TaxID=50712 RepID=A0A5M6HYW5_9HYPH|nr:phosphatidate cytidylyltransferase [Blastochloris sulfoviridis]KAA5601111.1 phosphatidate cytidylyltransferase [Blastochloris sulfoviridis]